MVKAKKKGDSFEYLIQKQIRELIEDLGLRCKFDRVGMSGQLDGKKGDFEWRFRFGRKLRGEAKKGKRVPVTLYNWLEKDSSDFLIISRDYKPTLLVTPLDNLETLLTCQERYEDRLQSQDEV